MLVTVDIVHIFSVIKSLKTIIREEGAEIRSPYLYLHSTYYIHISHDHRSSRLISSTRREREDFPHIHLKGVVNPIPSSSVFNTFPQL